MEEQEAKIKFQEFVKRKTDKAVNAHIPGYVTIRDVEEDDLSVIAIQGNTWTHHLFDGAFYRSKSKFLEFPECTAVFVQSKDGNTEDESGSPGALGGGETDLHLDYEGLSRVDADGVLAGANTIRKKSDSDPDIVFGVWHPELVKLRQKVHPSLYPAQIIVTGGGEIDMDRELLFNIPEIPVYVITTDGGAEKMSKQAGARDQVILIHAGDAIDWHESLRMLKSFGIEKISVVGGRTTVSELFDRGFISDLYLTTSAINAGKPNTPFYVGKRELPPYRVVLKKEGRENEKGVVFEHRVFLNSLL